MAASDRYATFANFGGGFSDKSTRPQITKVVLAECIKRKLPSKHYVYKMIVEWTSGTTSIVYRRYSMFFDFQVKLQELYQGMCQKHPQFVQKVPHLPELPGKILFGRSHIHQVAEKRRGKIEEFCQQVVSLPPEISHTNLVMGFFNTWPDDTMLPQHSESVSSTSSTFSPSHLLSPTSPSSLSAQNSTPFPTLGHGSGSATEAVISHPDEMENLEQYSVLADYHRKDSHQVNLSEGQVVHVIEKHDTGWWMVMSDDEQGYAPAAYLEPVEGLRKQHNVEQQRMETENSTCEEYEAMESYSAQSEDEVTFKTGDTIQVLSKSLDGWWKIRCNNKVGMAPSALIRKPMEVPQVSSDDVIYESHKSIYEGLNLHKPPPRRNTIERNYSHLPPKQEVYAVPRPNPPLVKMATDPTISHTGDDDIDHDYVAPPLELTSEDEEDPGYYQVPRALQSSMSDTTSNKWNGSIYSPPPPSEDSTSTAGGQQRDSGSSGGDPPIFPERDDVGGGIYEAVPEESSHYEMETTGAPDSSVSAAPVYQNADDARAEAEAFKSSRSNSTELLNVTGGGGQNSSGPVTPLTASPPPHSHTTPSIEPNQDDGDYVDIDQHDEYVDPGELMGGGESSSGDPVPPTSPSFDLFKPLPKPPLPTSDPPKKKPVMAKSKSLGMELYDDTMEDEYIPMDPIYTEPPVDETEQPATPNPAPSQQQLQQYQKQQKQSKTPAPSTPSSTSSSSFFASSPSPAGGKTKKGYSKVKVARDKVQISSPVLVEMNSVGLSKAKSLEDLLSAASSRESSPQRHGSPHSERKASPGRFSVFPPLPAPPGSPRTGSSGVVKRKLVKVKSAGKAGGKRASETPLVSGVPHHILTQSSSPPRDPSPEHRGVTHTTSVPTPPPFPPPLTTGGRKHSKDLTNSGHHLKTYVALSSYQSSVNGSLSFQAGDKCVLRRKTPDGWWLVNIGGREGWTPEVYWKEEAWTQTTTIARPPGPPPTVPPLLPPERKPRSHTVDAIGGGLPLVVSRQLELSSSMEGSLEASGQSSWGGSIEEETTPRGDAAETSRKTTPPPPPPQNTKPGRREPPLPKPKPGTGRYCTY
jgi:hypothetical protein